jgi:hypothetical protein
MTTILEMKRAELASVIRDIAETERQIRNFSYEVSEEEYDAILDDCYEDIDVCGSLFSPSYALKNLDPVAYRCGKSDYEGTIDLDEVPAYQELTSDLEDLEERRDSLEEEIADLEAEEEESEE